MLYLAIHIHTTVYSFKALSDHSYTIQEYFLIASNRFTDVTSRMTAVAPAPVDQTMGAPSTVTPTAPSASASPAFHSRAHIAVGDLVILYMTRDILKAITITPGEVFHNKFGRYTHDSLIGVKFGSKIHSPPPHAGYLYVLRPTPELWTLSLPHRTQILYTPDIAYITMRLGVRPGGKVLEAGTGSGSMTHSLSRSVGKEGRVLSYEYHEPRYQKAKEEFEGHGLDNVTLSHRNVCKDGFGDVKEVEAVFLDLPAPWEAVPYATKIMRVSYLLCIRVELIVG
jgi:tRNA A58 N-methylase Trm61